MVFNFSGAVEPNETVQRLEELLYIYLNLIYLNPALNCKLVESLDSTGGTSLENHCSRFMLLIVYDDWNQKIKYFVAAFRDVPVDSFMSRL